MSAMDPTEMLELSCANAWRPVVEDRIGNWRLRAAGGFTGRANSALAIGDPGVAMAQALDRVCEFAHSQRIPPVVQAVAGGPVERSVAAAGWRPHTGHAGGHLVSVQVGPLGDGGGGADVSVLAEPVPGWWELTAGTARPTPAQRHVLGTGEIGYGLAGAAEAPRGAVRAAVVGDLLHVARLAVEPEHRRRGLARALMAVCGPWAAARGAASCVLQVAVDNTPALALYRALGFREHHRYRYWVPAWKDRSL